MNNKEILRTLYHLKDYWKGDVTLDYLIKMYEELYYDPNHIIKKCEHEWIWKTTPDESIEECKLCGEIK